MAICMSDCPNAEAVNLSTPRRPPFESKTIAAAPISPAAPKPDLTSSHLSRTALHALLSGTPSLADKALTPAISDVLFFLFDNVPD